MTIDIEIKSPEAFTDIYELRNLIQEAEVEGLQIKLKEQAPVEGTMSGGFLAVAGIVGSLVGETALKASLELVFHHTIQSLEPAFQKFLQKLHLLGKKDVEIYTEIGDGDLKKSYVTNSNGQTTLLSRPHFAIDVQKTKAVLIGNSEFDFNFPTIKPVQGNLEDFYNLLINKKITGLPPENITLLLNKDSGEIEEQLLLASKLPNVETLLIYYAGHGCRTDRSKLYLVAKNTKKIDDHIISGIDFDFIKNIILKQSTASQKILILDACHSGIATQGADDIFTSFNVAGTYTFASSSPDEVSFYHPEKNNTFFTGEIINVLTNGLDNNKENIALNDIYETVTSNLKEKNFPEPHYKSDLTIKPSDFYIARNSKFSTEAWIQRASALHRLGRIDEAIHEYNLLIQRFPEDNSLKEALEDCINDKKFIDLVYEADELFKSKAYSEALNKYDEALQIKNDFTTLQNRNKCAQYFEVWKQFSKENDDKSGEVTTGQKITEEKKEEAQIKAKPVNKEIKFIKQEEKIQPVKKENNIVDKQKEIEKQKPPFPVSRPAGLKIWTYIFCGIVGIYYLVMTLSIVNSLSKDFDRYLMPVYLQQAFFLLLIPLQIFLFLTMRKAGWIISLFTAILQIAILLWLILMRDSYYSPHSINFSVPVAYIAIIAFGAFSVFLLQKKTMQPFNITNREMVSTLIISGITGIVYYNYLSSVMNT